MNHTLRPSASVSHSAGICRKFPVDQVLGELFHAQPQGMLRSSLSTRLSWGELNTETCGWRCARIKVNQQETIDDLGLTAPSHEGVREGCSSQKRREQPPRSCGVQGGSQPAVTPQRDTRGVNTSYPLVPSLGFLCQTQLESPRQGSLWLQFI